MNAKAAAGLFLGVVFFLLLIVAILSIATPWPAGAPVNTDVGYAKWGVRSFEVLLQGIILLAGVVAIILLLGSRRSREVPPW
jgi:hypothetical protein